MLVGVPACGLETGFWRVSSGGAGGAATVEGSAGRVGVKYSALVGVSSEESMPERDGWKPLGTPRGRIREGAIGGKVSSMKMRSWTRAAGGAAATLSPTSVSSTGAASFTVWIDTGRPQDGQA